MISERDGALVERLAASVHAHDLAAELIADGVAEGVARCELFGVPCQIRCDWLNPRRGLVDLKTCDEITWFERDAKRYGYVHQMAFYRAVLRAVSGITVPVHVIAVEKRRPHRAGVWLVDEAALDLAENENEAAIELLKRCRKTEVWPTGYESLRILTA